jgi:hypothetical protein
MVAVRSVAAPAAHSLFQAEQHGGHVFGGLGVEKLARLCLLSKWSVCQLLVSQDFSFAISYSIKAGCQHRNQQRNFFVAVVARGKFHAK